MGGDSGDRGRRARGLALLLLAALLAAMARDRLWPGAWTPPAGPVAAEDRDGMARIVSLDEARRRAAEISAACRSAPIPLPASSVLEERGCRLKVRPLSAGARRVLGLALDPSLLTEQDLAQVAGIGPKLARRISQAKARTLEEIDEVPGVGPARLTAVRAALTPLVPGW